MHIARMVGNFERAHDVIHQDDDANFQPTDEDVDIVKKVSELYRPAVWITADIAQKRKPDERAALRDSGLSVFFFKGIFGEGKDPHFQVLKVLSAWPRIVEEATRAKVPTAYEIPCGPAGVRLAKIDRLGPTAELFKKA